MADKDQKTEQPTQRRLRKAREEGNFPAARVFVSALQFPVFVGLLGAYGPRWIQTFRVELIAVLQHALNPELSTSEVIRLCLDLLKQTMTGLAMLGGVLLAMTLAIQMAVTRLGVSLKKLSPDLKRMNPLAHLRELPKRNLPSLIQAVIMIPAFGTAVYFLVRNNLEAYLQLPLKSVQAGIAQAGESLQALLWKASFVFLVFGFVDLLRQKRRYHQDLKMSKQDIRDELKEVEGSPLMKSRIRRLRRDGARRRMMHEVPTATAVVVNPTHYAVALKYSMNSEGAPKVVAKGKNYLALRIREKAVANQVPLIENPPLAQALYKSVEVGQEIPAHFYRAVAEVLAYIFRLMRSRRPD